MDESHVRIAVLEVKVQNLENRDKERSEEVSGLRKSVIGFALTVAGSAVAFAVTVILVWGGS